jgi:hypothetical protein
MTFREEAALRIFLKALDGYIGGTHISISPEAITTCVGVAGDLERALAKDQPYPPEDAPSQQEELRRQVARQADRITFLEGLAEGMDGRIAQLERRVKELEFKR